MNELNLYNVICRLLASVFLIILHSICISAQKPGDNVHSIFIDQFKNLWIGTDNGLIRNNGDKWEAYFDAKNTVFSINDIKKQNGMDTDLWVGTTTGVFKINYLKDGINSVRRYRLPEIPFKSDSILAITFDKDHTGYFATPKGIGILVKEVWRFYTRLIDIIRDEFTSVGVKGDTIYFGTRGEGVARIVKQIDGFTGASSYITPWSQLAGDSIIRIFIDSKGYQWYGTTRGLSRHSSSEAKEGWDSIEIDQMRLHHVTAIVEDKKGNMWVGTLGGLVRIGTDLKEIRKWTEKDGLPSNIINCICVDTDQSIWIGTSLGVSHFTEAGFMNFRTSEYAKDFIYF